MTRKYYADDDISFEDWMQEQETVLDAYAREVGNMRAAIAQNAKNIEILLNKFGAIEERLDEYDIE